MRSSLPRLLFGIFLAALLPPALCADEPWRIYLAPDDHTDYLWSADGATYDRAFLETIDDYLDQAAKTRNDLAPFQARWNVYRSPTPRPSTLSPGDDRNQSLPGPPHRASRARSLRAAAVGVRE